MTAGLPNGTFSELNMKICKTFANDGCMKSHKGRRGTDKILRPLLLFSPGFGQSRLVYNAMAHSVASEGYIVVSIDHPYDANVVEYPDRSYVRAANISSDDEAALNALIDVRAQDVSFVADELQNSATLRQVIGKSGNMIDFGKVLMYGHSLGGATAATVMLADGRIRGGVNLDGRFFDKVLAKGISHPFLNVGRPYHRLEDSTWDQFYNSSSGPIVEAQVAGTLHAAFTDFPVVVGTWNPNDSDVFEALQAFLGTIPWMRAGEIVTRLVTTFAEFVFDGRNSTILSGTDSSFAEVGLVRSQLHQ
ncbi:hypothetical protein E8E14_014579 [Neopestalotiopsis sp. 37M]|nr:hypothetical protein E8E14_014579 [Neopestalotiopsis sp. 37M]